MIDRRQQAPMPAHIELNRLAVLWDMSPRYIKERVKEGDLVAYRMGNRLVIDAASAAQFLSARRISGAAFCDE